MQAVEKLLSLVSPTAALRRATRLRELGRDAEAFPLYAHAAKSGLAEAEHQVALCYFGGLGVPASRAEGARWLERAAERGHLELQTLLAGLCVHGLVDIGGGEKGGLFESDQVRKPDFDSALKWARRAADAGSAKGQAELAYVLTRGPERLRDLDAAHALYRRSADAGCPEGCLGYALSLAQRAADEAGRREVVEYLRRAAAAELPTAIYLLAVLVERGVGATADPALAVELFRQAAEKGLPAAQARWAPR